MDRIDRAILRELTHNARTSFRDLGERVNLSANAVAERVRRLVAGGVIRGFRADVNPAALGLQMSAYVDIKTGSSAGPEELGKLLARFTEVRRAVWTTGEFDFTLEVLYRDQADLVRIIEFLRTRGAVRETRTRMICMELSTQGGCGPGFDEESGS